MKAYSFKICDKTVVVIENEHKEAEVIFGEQHKDFPSYKEALYWAKIEEMNGYRSIVNH